LGFGCSCLTQNAKPRILIPSEQIAKRKVLDACIPGSTRKIQLVDFETYSGDEIAVLGQTGIWLLSAQDYTLIKRYDFLDKGGETIGFGLSPELVDLNNKGTFQIMKGGGGFGDVGLLNDKGEEVWTFHPHPQFNPNKMIAGDINQDHIIEFYVADDSGLYQIDQHGAIMWHVDGDRFTDLKIFENEILGKYRLIAVDQDRQFQIFDFHGNKLERFKPKKKIFEFDIVSWSDSPLILGGYFKSKIVLMDLGGSIVFEYKLENFPLYHAPQGIVVKFFADNPPFLVVLAYSRSSVGLSQVNIFSPEGKLIYQEIIEGNASMLAKPDKRTGEEVLLVGGSKGVWEYTFRKNSY
jgi:hypothetical protein